MRIEPPAAPETLHRLLQFTPDAPLREVPELACDVVVVDDGQVFVSTPAAPGSNEVQRLTLEVVGVPAPTVTSSVTEEVAANTLNRSEIKSINFTTPDRKSVV